MSAAVEKEKVQIERVWAAISALQAYGQRTGNIRLGSALLPIVQTVLRALRDPGDEVIDAAYAELDGRLSSATVRTMFALVIDHLLAD